MSFFGFEPESVWDVVKLFMVFAAGLLTLAFGFIAGLMVIFKHLFL